ncbi:MAG: hypothetical protein Crog4KO_08970 [Crocinitomicaceae bacterium]
MNYKKINTYLGWLIFIIATTVYFITLEDSVSLWDCGEYVTAAYKLEVGHPPGAPLFMVLGRLASFFADPEYVAVWINRLSALSSSATILFMFWSITLLVKKMILRTKETLDQGDKIAILGSAVVGSLAYAFSDSFWFSAVEGEVYAMSSLFTAIIFWAALKWDDEMMSIKKGIILPKKYSPDRWLLFIMFMLGLAIGVHLLGILVVPAIAYIIYFRFKGISKRFYIIYLGLLVVGTIINVFGNSVISGGTMAMMLIVGLPITIGIWYLIYLWSTKSKIVEFLLVGVMSLSILNFIQNIVITGTISIASNLEVGFVNSMGMPFYSGAIFFFAILIGAIVYLLRYSRKKGNRSLYSIVAGLMLLLIGYGSFAVIVIRSNANTPLDENDPETLVTLHSYLKREQYGSAPLMFGQYWNSREAGGEFRDRGDGNQRWVPTANTEFWEDQAPIHYRRFQVFDGDVLIKAFKDEKSAKEYVSKNKGLTIEEGYFESNAATREKAVPTYSQSTFFPRMYWSADPARVQSYKDWISYDANADAGTEMGKDGKRLPTFGENLDFFFSYQVNWMYWRYFFWNFSGRQNDIQGSRGGAMRGNWLSGYGVIDNARLGNQDAAPYYTKENKSNNNFFLLPLVLGLIGLFFHVYRSPKQAFVLFLAFLFTGLAIVVYLNQKPLEPRERDYAYAGSFYFFAMWIGIGVYGLYDTFRKISTKTLKNLGIAAGGGLLLFLMFDIGAPVGMPATMTWIIIVLLMAVMLGIMVGVQKVTQKNMHGALVATLIGLVVPIIMGMQGWDDHDRSLKTSAHDLAYNYLVSCEKNGIIFTNGDNDTFPLWYMQEVEEKFTDRRVCNLSLMQTDWYTNQMKMKAYGSEPLPIKFTEDQILMNYGGTDQVLFQGLLDLMFNDASDKRIVKKMIAMRVKQNPGLAKTAVQNLQRNIPQAMAGAKGNSAQMTEQLRKYIAITNKAIDANDISAAVYEKFFVACRILDAVNSRQIEIEPNNYGLLRDAIFNFEDGWDITNLQEAMAFLRDDDNMMPLEVGGTSYRIFPSTGFVLPVNKKNVIDSKMVSSKDWEDCRKEVRFRFKYNEKKDRIPASRARQLTKNGLTREQVMMMDIIANNNWERPIYFSSPSGSDVASALLHGYSGTFMDGCVKQNGMAFEMTPLDGNSPGINRDRMYDNLMNKYHYGNMDNPGVLTDYYTRRHTSQYRSHFLRLAREYASDAIRSEDYLAQTKGNPGAQVAGLLTEKEIKEYKKRAAALLKKSLEVMPVDIVIDHSEPTATGEVYEVNGKQTRGYTDGVLHDYVEVLYLAGDKKTAMKLAKQLAGQLETVFEFFDKSDPRIVSDRDNVKDLYAAIESYFAIYAAVADNELGNPGSDLDRKMLAKIDYLYNTTIPNMVSALKEAAEDNGEALSRGSSEGGTYAMRMYQIMDYTDGMALRVGFKQPDAPTQQQQQQLQQQQIQQQMQQQLQQQGAQPQNVPGAGGGTQGQPPVNPQ